MNMDYQNVGVYATCDSWFCLGMDEFQNTTGACSRGCGSGRTASYHIIWAVRFSAVLRDSEGDKIEALFEGHYCTELLFENKHKEGLHINAPGRGRLVQERQRNSGRSMHLVTWLGSTKGRRRREGVDTCSTIWDPRSCCTGTTGTHCTRGTSGDSTLSTSDALPWGAWPRNAAVDTHK